MEIQQIRGKERKQANKQKVQCCQDPCTRKSKEGTAHRAGNWCAPPRRRPLAARAPPAAEVPSSLAHLLSYFVGFLGSAGTRSKGRKRGGKAIKIKTKSQGAACGEPVRVARRGPLVCGAFLPAVIPSRLLGARRAARAL